jgi:hypothetical protein
VSETAEARTRVAPRWWWWVWVVVVAPVVNAVAIVYDHAEPKVDGLAIVVVLGVIAATVALLRFTPLLLWAPVGVVLTALATVPAVVVTYVVFLYVALSESSAS